MPTALKEVSRSADRGDSNAGSSALRSESADILSRGDQALAAFTGGGKYAESNYMVKEAGNTYVDFAMAEDIYKKQPSAAATQAADAKLDI